MPGVALGFLFGAIFVSIPTDVFLLSRTLQVSLGELSRPYLPFFWRFAVAGSVAWAVHNWFGAATILNMAIAVSITGVVYLLLVIPYVWTTPLRGYIQNATAAITSAMRARVLGWSGKA